MRNTYESRLENIEILFGGVRVCCFIMYSKRQGMEERSGKSNRIQCVCVDGGQLTANRSDEWAHMSAESDGISIYKKKKWILLQATC